MMLTAGCARDTDSADLILILYAFPAEGELLAKNMAVDRTHRMLGRQVKIGEIHDREIILAESGIGMTNAAMTAQRLIDRYHPVKIVFSGIAGAVDSSVHIGDIVICTSWVTHDFGYIGSEGLVPGDISSYHAAADSIVTTRYFHIDSAMRAEVTAISGRNLALDPIGERTPKVVVDGNGVSGNSFIDSREKRMWLSGNFQALVTDMESAAVAQVCTANGIPFVIFRSASDLAGGSGSESARDEIDQFFKVAAHNSARVVLQFLDEL
ncbi:MAG: 5'-methylthioadenosine/S-adenosylhomocysteine nucleosidase [Candidatus Zixiibacteriota bacterium]|nr:MAG: 5'-methylthioadenosine/S-adenosylhomocysteine nucleosidase [candidate division Zixibacteria bacterium]